MRFFDFAPAAYKKQPKITFEVVEDEQGDENRGWIDHVINACIGSDCVGRLRISYIPKSRFVARYPSIYNFGAAVAGHAGWLLSDKHADYHTLDTNGLLNLYYYSLPNHWQWSRDAFVHMTREELLVALEKREVELNKGELGERFRRFQKEQVDAPYIAFIHVDPEFRRRGIGIALYLEGAKLMASKGLRLRASTLQTPEAEATWEAMEKRGLVEYDPETNRRYVKAPQ